MDRSQYVEILNAAIEGEIEAHQFYQELSTRISQPHLKEMFNTFAQEELKHRRILEKFRDDDKARLAFGRVPDLKVAETVDTPKLSIDMKPADAIALAMKKEQAAMEHYTNLAMACEDGSQQEIFQQLAAMERQHKYKMEQAFVDIGYPEVW